MLIDTHIHCTCSGHAGNSAKAIIAHSKKNGIVPALTDHNSINGWTAFEREAKQEGIKFILGEEVKIIENGSCKGEVLGLFLNEEVKPGTFGEVIDAFRAQDAFISIAHPFDRFRKALLARSDKPLELIKKVDAIEIFNSRSWLSSFNMDAQEFAEKHSMPFTVGTDAHFPVELGNAFMEIDASDLEEARKKMLKGSAIFQARMSPRRVHIMTQLAKLGFFK